MKSIIVLGSTGSIGRNTLDVVRRNPGRIKVAGLAAGRNTALLEKQVKEFMPEAVCVADKGKACALKKSLAGTGVRVYGGEEGIIDIVREDADMAVLAMVGIAGLVPAVEAVRSGKDIALANKEVLVAGGEILINEAKDKDADIIPVDSEHSALMQCLWKRNPEEVKRVFLTASGGPFYNTPDTDFSMVSPEDALRHPTWKMGKKVTVDSATLMNKGFEVIEAGILFGIPADRIEVLIHPESIVHAMAEFTDGTLSAVMHVTDMRLPIQYALSWPFRWPADYGSVDLSSIKSLNFAPVSAERFPAVRMAYRALEAGGTMRTVLSTADEVCVTRFLKGQMRFDHIIPSIERMMNLHNPISSPGLDDILDTDRWVREELAEGVEV